MYILYIYKLMYLFCFWKKWSFRNFQSINMLMLAYHR